MHYRAMSISRLEFPEIIAVSDLKAMIPFYHLVLCVGKICIRTFEVPSKLAILDLF